MLASGVWRLHPNRHSRRDRAGPTVEQAVNWIITDRIELVAFPATQPLVGDKPLEPPAEVVVEPWDLREISHGWPVVRSLAGEETSGLSEGRLADIRQRRIGFVFQSFHLVPRLTGLKNVELPMVFAGVSSSERKERARGALHSVGLDHRTNHRPDQLSGGERQRVAIARSIVMKPDLLLADEPTGNLDTRAGNEIISVIEAMNGNGLTVVLVTHNATLAARAQRVVRLVDGRVSGNGTESPS